MAFDANEARSAWPHLSLVYDTNTLSWIRMTQPAGGGGGGDATEATLQSILAELQQKTEPANTQAVSAASLPLPAGASTETTLGLIKAKTDNLDVLLSTRTKPSDQQHVIVDSSASVPVSLASLPPDPVSAPVTGTWDSSTAQDAAVTLDCTGYGTFAVSFVATGTITTGTAIYEISHDGVKWQAITTTANAGASLTPPAATQALNAILTTGNFFRGPCAAYRNVRVRLSAVITGGGSIAVSVQAGIGTFAPVVSVGANTVIQGLPNVVSAAWPIEVTDGANIAKVRGASSPAIAGDAALVVAISPNNTIPVSAASLPLPAGAAKEAGGNLDSLVAKDFATQTTLATVSATLGNANEIPIANTLQDRINQLGKKLDSQTKVLATEATLRQLLIKMNPPLLRGSTLLHRGI